MEGTELCFDVPVEDDSYIAYFSTGKRPLLWLITSKRSYPVYSLFPLFLCPRP